MNERVESDDIRGALLASVSEIEERRPGSTGGLAAIAPKPEPAADAMVVDPPDDGKRVAATAAAKDPKTGKFVEKAEAEKPAVEAKDDKKVETKSDAVEVKPSEAKSLDVAPGSLPADIKAEWANYSPKTKEYLVKTEQERGQAAGKAGFELRQLKAQYEPLEALIGPRRAAVVAQNGSVENWLDQMIKYSDFAGQDPEGFLSWYLSQPNIGGMVDLGKLLGQPAQEGAQSDPALASPVVKQLQQTISGLATRLQNFEGQTQQNRVRSDVSEIDAFEAENDASGNPLRPHFATLRDSGALSKELRLVSEDHPDWSMRQRISEAYDNAVWKHSDTRNIMLTERERHLVDQQKKVTEDKEAKDRAEAASRARKFVTGQPPASIVSAPGGPNDDLKAEIAANYQAALQNSTARL